MRLAVSGSHGTGKSTLIAAFVGRRPEYVHEPEAFETLGDDVDLSDSGAPTAEGLQALLEYTTRAIAAHAPGACVVHERSPVDYLAYAAASRGGWPKGEVGRFLKSHVPVVRASLRHLDLIAFLPVSAMGPHARPGEDPRFRRRVDERLRRALIDDEYDLLGEGAPRIVELSPSPDRQLDVLIRLTEGDTQGRNRLEA
jgi:AAA domain